MPKDASAKKDGIAETIATLVNKYASDYLADQVKVATLVKELVIGPDKDGHLQDFLKKLGSDALADEQLKAALAKRFDVNAIIAELIKAELNKTYGTEAVIDFVKKHFGNDLASRPSTAEKEAGKAAKKRKHSWPKTIFALSAFLVFLYCVIIHIWIIARSAKASGSGTAPSPNATRVAYTSSYPTNGYTQPTLTQTRFNDDVTYRVTSLASATTKRITRTVAVTYSNAQGMVRVRRMPPSPTVILPTADSTIKISPPPTASTSARASTSVTLRQDTATHDSSTSCLYVKNTQLSKHGGVALFLHILNQIVVILFYVILVFYEHSRLRFSREVHSAGVVGLMEAWLGLAYLNQGVEGQMIVAAGGILLVALVNLCYGLPKMKFRKVLLLPYLVSESDYYSLIPAGRSYAAPRKDGDYAAKVDDVVQALNEGIENEDRTMRRTTSATLRRRITPYNAGHVDLEPYEVLPQPYLNPGYYWKASPQDLRKHAVISPEIEGRVVGGIKPFEMAALELGHHDSFSRVLMQNLMGKMNSKDRHQDPFETFTALQMIRDLEGQRRGVAMPSMRMPRYGVNYGYPYAGNPGDAIA